MPLIVVMDDDAGTRMLVSQVLKKDGYEVLAADDGVKGLALIRAHKPDLVVSDVQMPEMDGFQVLESVRADGDIAATPIILLTSLAERGHMRQGMTTGADDYLTKPFTPQELRDAVEAQLNKLVRTGAVRSMAIDAAVTIALEEQRAKIDDLYEQRLASSLSQQWPDGGLVGSNQKFTSATVLFAEIKGYALWAQSLSSSELGDLIRQFYGTAGDTVHLFGAHHMQFVGDGMLSVFVDAGDTPSVNHGLRAVRAAVGLKEAATRMTGFVKKTFGERPLPPFALNTALHSGPVAFAKLEGLFGVSDTNTPLGDTVTAVLKLYGGEPAIDWPIAASVQTARLVTGAVKSGRRAMINIAGRSMVFDAVELVSLA
jgi:DNA-binding response OmpR family regulator